MLSLRVYGPCTALLGSLCCRKTVKLRTSLRAMYADYDDDNEIESPRQLQEHIEYAFVTKDAKELGQRTVVRLQILRLLPAVLSLYSIRLLLLVILPICWYYQSYGLILSLILQISAYIASRPLVGSARRYIEISAYTLLRNDRGEIYRDLPGKRASFVKMGRFVSRMRIFWKDVWFVPYLKLEKFVLSKHMHQISAAGLCGERFGSVLEQLLPEDPDVREIIVKLADDYYDSLESLIKAGELLV